MKSNTAQTKRCTGNREMRHLLRRVRELNAQPPGLHWISPKNCTTPQYRCPYPPIFTRQVQQTMQPGLISGNSRHFGPAMRETEHMILYYTLLALPPALNHLLGWWLETRVFNNLPVHKARHNARIAGIIQMALCAALILKWLPEWQTDPWVVLQWNPHSLVPFTLMVGGALAAALLINNTSRLHPTLESGPAYKVGYAIVWAAYLFVYEFFFRGLLWIAFPAEANRMVLLLMNMILYLGVHFYKEKAEIAGSIPLGLAAFWASAAAGNIWPAVVAHWIISVMCDLRVGIIVNQRKKRTS
jgi:hypothetical protein